MSSSRRWVRRSRSIRTSLRRRWRPVVDVDQLELAVINLIMNARDSMPDGGSVVVTILPESTDTTDVVNGRADRFVCLSVGDTGEGMDQTILSRAMEPFFSTKGIGKG